MKISLVCCYWSAEIWSTYKNIMQNTKRIRLLNATLDHILLCGINSVLTYIFAN